MQILKKYPQLKVIQALARRRRVGVFLVGGFLRDAVLGRANVDFDFAVEKNALKFAEKFADEIKGAYVPLDEENGCARVAKKQDGEIITFDFADFRGPTLKDDLKLRDFTVNTLSVDLVALAEEDDLFDAIRDEARAMKDIKSKRIKRVSIRAFRDDPLRMLRAFAHKAQLGFRIELTTLNQIRKEADALREVSAERVREEFFKILDSGRAAQTLKDMDKSGVLEKVIPQVRVMFDCPQGGYHHLDVWAHSLETVAQVEKVFAKCAGSADIQKYLDKKFAGTHSRRGLIKLAALLHDIGKPDTRKIEEDRYSFHGHEHVGADIATIVAKQLKLSTAERRALDDMVRMHLRPGYMSNFKAPSERMFFRYLRDAKDEAASIALLSWADQRSTRGPLTSEEDQKHHQSICEQIIGRYFAKLKEKPFVPLITGDDLIQKLKLTPSPLFAKILAKVEEQQALGKIKTKAEALDVARSVAG